MLERADLYAPSDHKPSVRIALHPVGRLRVAQGLHLLRAGAVIVPREKLLHEVWGYNAAVTTHTLETHIYRLRQKIEVDPSQASLLVTAAGGYKLVA